MNPRLADDLQNAYGPVTALHPLGRLHKQSVGGSKMKESRELHDMQGGSSQSAPAFLNPHRR